MLLKEWKIVRITFKQAIMQLVFALLEAATVGVFLLICRSMRF